MSRTPGPTPSIQRVAANSPSTSHRHASHETIIMMPTTQVRSIVVVHLQASRPVQPPMMAWRKLQTFGAHFSRATTRLARTARASSRYAVTFHPHLRSQTSPAPSRHIPLQQLPSLGTIPRSPCQSNLLVEGAQPTLHITFGAPLYCRRHEHYGVS